MKKKKKIYSFINNYKKYVPILAKEIVETFKIKADSNNVEYNFTIDGTDKKIKGNEANTYFFFDTNGDTCLHDLKKSLFDEDLKHIKEGSEEEKNLMEDVREFLLKVCNEMTKKYNKDIKEVIRRVVLGNKYNEATVPLETIEVVSIDIADYSSILESYKYILKIGKKAGVEINTDEIIIFIQNRQEKTGMDINNILSIEKRAGNPLFEDVLSIGTGRKFLNEISIYFFIDYSISVPQMAEEENT